MNSSRAMASRLRFILMETSQPGNVGAAARAIKTMGFHRLVLVNPRDFNVLMHEEAIAFASGAQDILQDAVQAHSFEEAIFGCLFAAAITARPREFSPPVATPRDLSHQIASMQGDIALVFGNERFGLPNHIVEQCSCVVTIPANPEYSSLNLAQAVQLLAYECRMASIEEDADQSKHVGFRGEKAKLDEIEGMYLHLEDALIAIDFLDPHHPKKLMPRLRRLLSRSELEVEEVNILRGIANQILKTIEK